MEIEVLLHSIYDLFIDQMSLEEGFELLLGDLVRYVIAAVGMYFAVRILVNRGFGHKLIQKMKPKTGQYKREILASIRTSFIFATIGALTILGSFYGLQQWMLPGEAGFVWIICSVPLMLIAHDAYFYWTHRMMHHPKLFNAFHREHHLSITPTPFTAYDFSWREAIVEAGFLPLWLIAIPTPIESSVAFLIVMTLRNVWGHSGISLEPRWMIDHPILGNITTTVHHDLHHGNSFSHNYGLYFTWWDRWMGTENPKYREKFLEICDHRQATKNDSQ